MTFHLLLIEDDETAIYVTQKLLKQCGFTAQIDVVRNGNEALEYLACEGPFAERATGNPSLIVLDLKLPELDGFEVLKHIRSTPKLSEIPVFILSASKSEEDIYRSNLLGISRYMVKPLSVAEFSPEVNKFMDAGNDHDSPDE
jgi:CheY-like chemotaxis protein